jgi:hypothetical protein
MHVHSSFGTLGAPIEVHRELLMEEIARIVAEAKATNSTLRVGPEAKRLDDTYPVSGFSRGRIIDELILAASNLGVSVEVDRGG